MASRTTSFDVADYLDSPETIAAYMTEALETGEPELVASALGAIARAKGMTQVAKESGLGRESLYKALSVDGRPGFDTVLRVFKALGLSLNARPLVAELGSNDESRCGRKGDLATPPKTNLAFYRRRS